MVFNRYQAGDWLFLGRLRTILVWGSLCKEKIESNL